MFTSVLFLILCLLVLGLGPILHPLVTTRPKLMNFLDGFVLTAVLALLFCHILPHAMESQGLWVLGVALLGLLVPGIIEKLGHRLATASHQTSLILAIIGLAFHMFTDGIALIQPEAIHGHSVDGASIVPLAILIHSIPMALMVWWIIRPSTSLKTALVTLAILGLALIFGFAFGFYVASASHESSFGLFQGLVMGSLLHVMFHRHDFHDHKANQAEWLWPQGLGSIVAITSGLILNHYIPILSHSDYWEQTSQLFLNLALTSAPALLFAYLAGGFIQVFMPKTSVNWLKKGTPFTQSLKGMLFGLPLPVCSCGVVPLYKSLMKKGVPLSAGLAFFVATPELGFDAILLSLPLLGQTMMWIRLFSAASVALIVGWLIHFFASQPHASHQDASSEKEEPKIKTTAFQKIQLSIHSAFGEILDHTGPWILVGLVVASLIEPVMSLNFFQSIPSILQVPLMALMGMPIYVCASGATPLVAIWLAHGLSPGAALAFLITGPATNVTTFGILSQFNGRRVAISFAIMMFIFPVILGYIVNYLFPGFESPHHVLHSHDHESTPLQFFSLGILALAFLLLLIRKGPRHLINQIVSFEESHTSHDSQEHAHSHHNHNLHTTTSKPEPKKDTCCH